MRFSISLILATALATLSAGAYGEPLNGTEITVNPLPPGGGGKLLLYPGGQYMRVVQPLRQPGQNGAANGPIQLHMPGKAPAPRAASVSRAPRVAAAPRPPRTAEAAPRPQPAAPRAAPASPPARQVAEAPPPKAAAANKSGYNPSYGDFGAPQSSPGGMVLAMPGAPAAAPAPSAPAQKAERAAPPKQVAKAGPPPPSAIAPPAEPGLTKRSVILFAAGASDPAQSALGSIKFLAGDLNSSMRGPSSRIQLLAYGGDKGDNGSDARRLSLKRALAIRQVLIDDGVPSERIDVRAMGGADDGGPADRVDVFIKT